MRPNTAPRRKGFTPGTQVPQRSGGEPSGMAPGMAAKISDRSATLLPGDFL